jgi:hypothetical protein
MRGNLSQDSFLSDDFLRQLMSVGEVDLLVGIPSRNDAETIGAVMQSVEVGLLRNFPRARIVIVNVDAGSRDGTAEAVRKASSFGNGNTTGIESLRTLRWVSTSSRDEAAPGIMLHTILAAADLLHAKGCAVVSASTPNLTPAWIGTLLRPVCDDSFDFVAPLYSRHRYDGLLTRNLLYPLVRTLYGHAIRELRASEFAFSGRFAAQCLSRGEWHNEAVQGGAEMWMALHALSEGYRCCQTYLGPKARPRLQAGVVNVIRETLGGLFWCLEAAAPFWLKQEESGPVQTIGPDHNLTSEPVRIDRKRFLEMCRHGVAQLSPVLTTILDADTHAELLRLARVPDGEFRLSNSLWVRVIYEFAAAYHHSVLNRNHLVQAFIPIYRGRVYSLLAQRRAPTPEEMEADLEELCREFADQKAFFLERWKGKERGAS